MLFFNILLLTIAGLASAQIDFYKQKVGLRGMNVVPHDGMMLAKAHPSWINSGAMLDVAQYSPLIYDNDFRNGMIVGRGFARPFARSFDRSNMVFGNPRINFFNDNLSEHARAYGLFQPKNNNFAVHQLGNNLISGRLMRESVPIVKHVEDELPKPYAFAYDTADEFNNKMARQEQQDENGRVSGFYSYIDADGLMRRVDYIADEQGFRADVKTNEPGTANSVTGAALIQSDAPSVEAATVVAPKHSAIAAPIVIPNERAQLQKTPVVVRAMDGTTIQQPTFGHLSALKVNEPKIPISNGLISNGNILSLAQAKGFDLNPNFMRFALPSIAQSFGPTSLVKIADPSIGAQFLKAAAKAAAA